MSEKKPQIVTPTSVAFQDRNSQGHAPHKYADPSCVPPSLLEAPKTSAFPTVARIRTRSGSSSVTFLRSRRLVGTSTSLGQLQDVKKSGARIVAWGRWRWRWRSWRSWQRQSWCSCSSSGGGSGIYFAIIGSDKVHGNGMMCL